MSSGNDYPGADPASDPGDPFDRPPKEYPARGEETAPIRPDDEGPGYWERLAQQSQPTLPDGASGLGYWERLAQQGQVNLEDQAPPATQPYGYASPAYTSYALPSQPDATTAMVLGLVGLVGGLATCGLLLLVSPAAWVVGSRSKRAIRDSAGQLGGEGNAQAGLVMGIIGTVLLVLAVIAVVVIVIALVAFGRSTGTVSTGIPA